MLFLLALVTATIAGLVLWKAMTVRPPRAGNGPAARPAAPDDDPEFLRQLSERLRREGGDPRR